MTEEIIIDGVDVARCCCYENSKCLWTKRYYENNIAPDCEKVKDCYYKQLKHLEQENKELKEEIQFHNKENSNLLAERNAAQIGYDEIREVRERYRSVLEEIRILATKNVSIENFVKIQNKINEMLQ